MKGRPGTSEKPPIRLCLPRQHRLLRSAEGSPQVSRLGASAGARPNSSAAYASSWPWCWHWRSKASGTVHEKLKPRGFGALWCVLDSCEERCSGFALLRWRQERRRHLLERREGSAGAIPEPEAEHHRMYIPSESPLRSCFPCVAWLACC